MYTEEVSINDPHHSTLYIVLVMDIDSVLNHVYASHFLWMIEIDAMRLLYISG